VANRHRYNTFGIIKLDIRNYEPKKFNKFNDGYFSSRGQTPPRLAGAAASSLANQEMLPRDRALAFLQSKRKSEASSGFILNWLSVSTRFHCGTFISSLTL